MAHTRERDIRPRILAGLKWSPVVGIYGMRQTGKTTLARRLCELLGGDYETLDRESVLEASRNAPRAFCERPRLLCVDEAQKAAWIFPEIKELVGTRRKPGTFLLTGSVRFTLRRELRESLTGRILLYELLPFTVSEASRKSPSHFLEHLFTAASRKKIIDHDFQVRRRGAPSDAEIVRHLRTGGLPVPCFARDTTLRQEWFQSYAETLITRDVSLADEKLRRIGYGQGTAFLRALALQQGREVNVSQLAAAAAMPHATAQRLLEACEALSVVDRILGEVRVVKSSRKMRIAWKDVALWNFFAGVPEHALSSDPTAIGTLIFLELRSQIDAMTPRPTLTHYRTRDGAEVPWVVRSQKKTVGLDFTPTESVGKREIKTMRNFIADEPSAIGIVMTAPKSTVVRLGDRIWALPYTLLF